MGEFTERGWSSEAEELYFTESSAESWEEGMVVGSGHVGALVYGNPGKLIISVAHERFFIPANPVPEAPLVANRLPAIVDAVLVGDSKSAGQILEKVAIEHGFDDLVWTNPLGMCANLRICSSVPVSESHVRAINLSRGEVATSWQLFDGGALTIRVVAPRGCESVGVSFESDSDLDLMLDLGMPSRPDGDGFMGARNAADSLQKVANIGDPVSFTLKSGGTSDCLSVTTVLHGGGSWSLSSGERLTSCISISAGQSQTLEMGVRVTGGELVTRSRLEPLSWQDAAAGQSEHAGLMARSRFMLANSSGGIHTEDVLRRARCGDEGARQRAVEIAYASGRYNAISASGDLPPTLQGVWQGTWTPAWSADYTLNGNVFNGGMASLVPTGTPELATSILRLVLPHLEDYRANAHRIFGVAGLLLPSRMSDNGRANHFSSEFPHVFWIGCGAWVLRLIADVISTTGDRSIVDDEVWELVRGVLEFAENATFIIDGKRRLAPGFSPENTPAGQPTPIASDPTMDVALLRDAARCAQLLGEARGDKSLHQRWSRVIEDLPPYRIASDGTLAEWLSQPWRENHAHRHASQLYPLWYEMDPAFIGEGETARQLRSAAAATIEAKLAWRAEDPTAPPGRMEMAFGLTQLGLAAAQLGMSDAALQCAEWLAIDHWTPALTTTHDAGSIFNMDASGGLPAVVAAMMMGSTRDSVSLFPALPRRWTQGCITGLTGRGGIIIHSMSWDQSSAEVWLSRRPRARWLNPSNEFHVGSGSGFRRVLGSQGTTRLGEEPTRFLFER